MGASSLIRRGLRMINKYLLRPPLKIGIRDLVFSPKILEPSKGLSADVFWLWYVWLISKWKGMASMIRMCVFDFPSRKMPVAPLNALVQPMPYLIQLPSCKKRKECVGRKDSWPMTCRRFNAALNSCPSSVMCHLEEISYGKKKARLISIFAKIILAFTIFAIQWNEDVEVSQSWKFYSQMTWL